MIMQSLFGRISNQVAPELPEEKKPESDPSVNEALSKFAVDLCLGELEARLVEKDGKSVTAHLPANCEKESTLIRGMLKSHVKAIATINELARAFASTLPQSKAKTPRSTETISTTTGSREELFSRGSPGKVKSMAFRKSGNMKNTETVLNFVESTVKKNAKSAIKMVASLIDSINSDSSIAGKPVIEGDFGESLGELHLFKERFSIYEKVFRKIKDNEKLSATLKEQVNKTLSQWKESSPEAIEGLFNKLPPELVEEILKDLPDLIRMTVIYRTPEALAKFREKLSQKVSEEGFHLKTDDKLQKGIPDTITMGYTAIHCDMKMRDPSGITINFEIQLQDSVYYPPASHSSKEVKPGKAPHFKHEQNKLSHTARKIDLKLDRDAEDLLTQSSCFVHLVSRHLLIEQYQSYSVMALKNMLAEEGNDFLNDPSKIDDLKSLKNRYKNNSTVLYHLGVIEECQKAMKGVKDAISNMSQV